MLSKKVTSFSCLTILITCISTSMTHPNFLLPWKQYRWNHSQYPQVMHPEWHNDSMFQIWRASTVYKYATTRNATSTYEFPWWQWSHYEGQFISINSLEMNCLPLLGHWFGCFWGATWPPTMWWTWIKWTEGENPSHMQHHLSRRQPPRNKC